MSFTWRVLIGLVAGFALGLGIAASHSPWLTQLTSVIEPVGIVWINAIRLAVIPLVVASLIVAVAKTGETQRIGRLGVRALVLLVITLAAAAVLALAIGLPAMRWIQTDPRMMMQSAGI